MQANKPRKNYTYMRYMSVWQNNVKRCKVTFSVSNAFSSTIFTHILTNVYKMEDTEIAHYVQILKNPGI